MPPKNPTRTPLPERLCNLERLLNAMVARRIDGVVASTMYIDRYEQASPSASGPARGNRVDTNFQEHRGNRQIRRGSLGISHHMGSHAALDEWHREHECPGRCHGGPRDESTLPFAGSRANVHRHDLGTTLSARTILDARWHHGRFALFEDPALAKLGALVHYLDVGGIPVSEAAGFVAVLTGAKRQCADDNALLDEIGRFLDHLYAAFSAEQPSGAPAC